MARPKKRVLETAAREALTKIAEQVVEEEIGRENASPGTIINGQKVPWTIKDMERIFSIVEFVPEETIPVTWNGIKFQLFAGVSMAVPSVVRDIYVEHRRRLRRAGESLRREDIQILGAGGLEPEAVKK